MFFSGNSTRATKEHGKNVIKHYTILKYEVFEEQLAATTCHFFHLGPKMLLLACFMSTVTVMSVKVKNKHVFYHHRKTEGVCTQRWKNNTCAVTFFYLVEIMT